MKKLFEGKNLTKFYGDYCALENVSISINEGEFISIIGPNGAGKTTLINVLTCKFKPNKGKITFRGKDVTGISPEKLVRMGVGRSFQLVSIFPDLTTLDVIRVAIIAREGLLNNFMTSLERYPDITDEAIKIAKTFELDEYLYTPSKYLPQGAKKLLDVASAFALKPEIIFLDEPTSGVSSKEKNKIMDTLKYATEKLGIKAVVQVEHDMDIVFSYSNRIVAMYQGKVFAEGPPEKILSDNEVVCNILGRKERTFT